MFEFPYPICCSVPHSSAFAILGLFSSTHFILVVMVLFLPISIPICLYKSCLNLYNCIITSLLLVCRQRGAICVFVDALGIHAHTYRWGFCWPIDIFLQIKHSDTCGAMTQHHLSSPTSDTLFSRTPNVLIYNLKSARGFIFLNSWFRNFFEDLTELFIIHFTVIPGALFGFTLKE